MNYRHQFHAGNFADIHKHLLLTRIIVYMQQKKSGFLYIDTHAGIGLYDLTSQDALKTKEAQTGVIQFLKATQFAPPNIKSLIAPYISILKHYEQETILKHYPGSPRIVHSLRRPQDRLSLIELHPQDSQLLANEFRGAGGVKVHKLNGWQALKAQLPPVERRGVILIDPPFEDRSEFQVICDHLYQAHKRFSSGTYCIWYPIKNRSILPSFHRAIKSIGFKQALVSEIFIRPQDKNSQTFDGSGMVILNPPYILKSELETLSPWLCNVLKANQSNGDFVLKAL